MTALSIRNMNDALAEREALQWESDAGQPADTEQSHYWFIERKAKRGNRWVFLRDFIGTKSEAADLWRKYFQGKQQGTRLIHKLAYSS